MFYISNYNELPYYSSTLTSLSPSYYCCFLATTKKNALFRIALSIAMILLLNLFNLITATILHLLLFFMGIIIIILQGNVQEI